MQSWGVWEKLGFHVIPDHFYYPIPNLNDLEKRKPWDDTFPTTGVDLNDGSQLDLLSDFERFSGEFAVPEELGFAHAGDGAVYYFLIRRYEPDRIIEVGSGVSASIALEASAKNETSTQITAVDPYPSDQLRRLEQQNGNFEILEAKAEDVDVSWYSQLRKGDFLFVDSTHVVQTDNDVVHLFLRVLPELENGVFAHFHDITFPHEHSRERIIENHRFWSEQYLLHAFLLFNEKYEVIWAMRHMCKKYRDELVDALSGYEGDSCGSSFWIKRTES